MSTQQDSGHAKNVANLSKFNQLIATFGATYNPGNANITLAALTTLQTNANTKLSGLNETLNTWKNQTNQREISFEELDKLSTKLLGSLQSSGVTDQTLDDFTALVKKMRGNGKLTKADAGKTNPGGSATNTDPANPPTPPPPVDTTISTAKQSFDNKLDHFDKMLLLLQGEPQYKPNEPDFTTPKLKTRQTNLIALNEAANLSYTNLRAARIDRNTFFYAKSTGLLDLVKLAKAYIKSVYGAASQQYKAATAIKFFRVVPAKNAS